MDKQIEPDWDENVEEDWTENIEVDWDEYIDCDWYEEERPKEDWWDYYEAPQETPEEPPSEEECFKAIIDFLFGDFVSFLKTSKNLPKSILGRTILFLMTQDFDYEPIARGVDLLATNEETEKEFETAVSLDVESMKSGNNREIVDRLIKIIIERHFSTSSYVYAALEIYSAVYNCFEEGYFFASDNKKKNFKDSIKDYINLAEILTMESGIENIDWDYLDKKAAELVEAEQ